MKLVKFLKIHLNLYTLISFNVYLIWANIRKHQFYMRTVFQIKNALQKKFKKCQKRLHNIHGWCLFISINLINT